ncbi:MAG: sugar nucleotide-binding protein [Pseudonocardiaceae bacterium]
MTEHRTVLVVGGGLVGGSVRRRLIQEGWSVITARRTAHAATDHVLDVATEGGRAALSRTVAAGAYSACVLIHGPSDVSWCDSNQALAIAAHQGAAAAVSGLGVTVVLVSTDNVFAGDRASYGVDARVAPLNAYGRAKLLAEREVLSDPTGRVIRVSLVYGPREDPQLRPNFAEDCLLSAQDPRATFAAPVDQSFTPIFVDDAGDAVARVASQPSDAPRLIHVAGRETCSRFEFAQEAYRVAGADPSRVVPVDRRATRWASRPRYSCLQETASALDPRLCPRSIHDGLVETWSRAADQRN